MPIYPLSRSSCCQLIPNLCLYCTFTAFSKRWRFLLLCYCLMRTVWNEAKGVQDLLRDMVFVTLMAGDVRKHKFWRTEDFKMEKEGWYGVSREDGLQWHEDGWAGRRVGQGPVGASGEMAGVLPSPRWISFSRGRKVKREVHDRSIESLLWAD